MDKKKGFFLMYVFVPGLIVCSITMVATLGLTNIAARLVCKWTSIQSSVLFTVKVDL